MKQFFPIYREAALTKALNTIHISSSVLIKKPIKLIEVSVTLDEEKITASSFFNCEAFY